MKNAQGFMEIASKYINYDERLSRVAAYIYAHLDDELDLNSLAEVAYLSPYHFHRIYRAVRGETVTTTVRRLRLHRAASQLVQSTRSVEEISRQAGYKNVQSFTRVFSTIYGMPPARYRTHGSHARYQAGVTEKNFDMYDISYKTIPNLEVVSANHSGSYLQINQAFDQLGGWLGARNLLDQDSRMIALYYDDPASVEEAQLRSRACFSINKTCVLEPPLERVTIAGGKYAVLQHRGSYVGLSAAYEWLFGTWLLQSGCELRDAPPFEEYLNTPLDTAPEDLLTDIYIPMA
jgi:AraC family transcriptional regulator